MSGIRRLALGHGHPTQPWLAQLHASPVPQARRNRERSGPKTMTTTPRPHPPASVRNGICAACHRFVKTKAGLLTSCARTRSRLDTQRSARRSGSHLTVMMY